MATRKPIRKKVAIKPQKEPKLPRISETAAILTSIQIARKKAETRLAVITQEAEDLQVQLRSLDTKQFEVQLEIQQLSAQKLP